MNLDIFQRDLMRKVIMVLVVGFLLTNATYSQEAQKQTPTIHNIEDLLKNPSFLKGQLVKGTFKAFQKIDSKNYLVSYETPDYQNHLYYLQKGTVKQRKAAGYYKIIDGNAQDINFDFADGQSMRITAIVSGTISYQTRLGVTSTVTKLTLVEIEPVN